MLQISRFMKSRHAINGFIFQVLILSFQTMNYSEPKAKAFTLSAFNIWFHLKGSTLVVSHMSCGLGWGRGRGR